MHNWTFSQRNVATVSKEQGEDVKEMEKKRHQG